ncbi:IS3 family transposase [Listeria seeligeri]|nr:IS3 family transposase [Listeria seeligeri]
MQEKSSGSLPKRRRGLWQQAIEDWIHYYNHHRIKTKLGCSPIQYREQMTA